MHKYGSVVLMVRGGETVNALVVQSVQQADGEHLTVVSLDPAKESPLLSGMNVDAAIRRDFVTPLTEGKTFGWKDVDLSILGFKLSNQSISDDPKVLGVKEVSEPETPTAEESSPADFSAELNQAKRIIEHQDEKIDVLEKELASVKAELSATTEGIDKQLQGIADATAKEAAPEAPRDPIENSEGSVTSSDPEPGSTSDNPLPG